MLVGKNINFAYGEHKILHGIDIEVAQGKVTALIGPNGSGKTTLMRCLNGILKPSSGTVTILWESINHFSARKLAEWIAYVPQFHSVTFPLSLFEAVLLGRRTDFTWSQNSHDLRVVARILKELNLTELSERPINQLSGGEQQKGAIARSLAQETPIILLDEPTNSLDIKHQYEIMARLINYSRTQNKGILVILHDINVASATVDNLVVLQKGKVIAEGRPEDIINPSLIKAVYGISGTVIQHRNRPYLLVEPEYDFVL
jgi:iron complex transport system ATP-binding protein